MIIVGLGNPEEKYKNTYHNVGFMVVDKVLELLDLKLKNTECKSKTVTIYKNSEKIVIAEPQTYMNLSGEAVRELVGKYGQALSDLIIIYDDIDLKCGDIRVRKEGSAGTHNGMRNIISLCSSNAISRVRVGIGKPIPPMQLVDYVLSKVTGENKELLDNAVLKVAKLLVDYINHKDFEKLARESKL